MVTNSVFRTGTPFKHFVWYLFTERCTMASEPIHAIDVLADIANTEGRVFRILVVEDNAADVRLLKEAFREVATPHSIFVANDGQDALDFVYCRRNHIEKPRPDLILLDINLPRLSGHDVLREIKRDPGLRSIVVLMFSSSADKEDVAAAYHAHANGYLKKPVELTEYFAIAKAIDEFWFHKARLPVEGPDRDAHPLPATAS
jgi:CheY-like chemotaxis protein